MKTSHYLDDISYLSAPLLFIIILNLESVKGASQISEVKGKLETNKKVCEKLTVCCLNLKTQGITAKE